ncbi:hypothetical protein QR680_003898 [Steinernema hermaphroditum]|uniref:Uncharacterized protein n=1 Tax=Steinernema hermaphroditum TaxID=289476 RepID=A0AA39LSC8_9BILA|nr:hypothetical protein QR680_003898 [Steinernema hermaphroditum]
MKKQVLLWTNRAFVDHNFVMTFFNFWKTNGDFEFHLCYEHGEDELNTVDMMKKDERNYYLYKCNGAVDEDDNIDNGDENDDVGFGKQKCTKVYDKK